MNDVEFVRAVRHRVGVEKGERESERVVSMGDGQRMFLQ